MGEGSAERVPARCYRLDSVCKQPFRVVNSNRGMSLNEPGLE